MNRSVILAVLVAAGIGVWLASGEITGGGRLDGAATSGAGGGESPAAAAAPERQAVAAAGAAGPFRVRVKRLQATPRSRDIVARGRTGIRRMVDVRAEVVGRIAEAVAREGSFVETGDVLARLDLRDRPERLAEARALVAQRELEHEAAQRLRAKGFRARTRTAEAAALLESARARLAAMEIALDRTVIRAPFAGVVERRHVELGDFVEKGDPIARIVDRSPILVIAHISERDIGYLDDRTTARVALATGEAFEGQLDYVASMADEATRTFRVAFRAPNPGLRIRAGVTAELHIAVDAVPAHFVSPAMLTLNDDGELGVKSVNGRNLVEFHRVDIIRDEAEGVWLGGLPETVRLITVGQEFVRDGDPVVPVADTGADAS